jgi:hypothetical protein
MNYSPVFFKFKMDEESATMNPYEYYDAHSDKCRLKRIREVIKNKYINILIVLFIEILLNTSC